LHYCVLHINYNFKFYAKKKIKIYFYLLKQIIALNWGRAADTATKSGTARGRRASIDCLIQQRAEKA
jgi:hypothetical protein